MNCQQCGAPFAQLYFPGGQLCDQCVAEARDNQHQKPPRRIIQGQNPEDRPPEYAKDSKPMTNKTLEQCAREAANACEEWCYTPQAQNAERNEAVEAFMEIITKHFQNAFAGDGLREAASAQILECDPQEYIALQFPATVGHIPLEKWFSNLREAIAHAPENGDTKRIDWLESQNNEPDFDWYVQELDSGKLMPHPLRKGTEWGTHYPTLRAAIDEAMRQSTERE